MDHCLLASDGIHVPDVPVFVDCLIGGFHFVLRFAFAYVNRDTPLVDSPQALFQFIFTLFSFPVGGGLNPAGAGLDFRWRGTIFDCVLVVLRPDVIKIRRERIHALTVFVFSGIVNCSSCVHVSISGGEVNFHFRIWLRWRSSLN